MLLRNSISNTKKFFQKTLQSFKSFFSGSPYQKIPKSPPSHNNPYNPYNYNSTVGVGIDMNGQTSFNNKDLDKFYNDFTNRSSWEDPDKEKAKKRSNRKQIIASPSSSSSKQEKDDLNGSFMKFSKAAYTPVKNYEIQRREGYSYNHNNKVKISNIYKGKGSSREDYDARDEGRKSYLVAQKLKELEMMDVSNVDHVLDIEEVLHYYSRLTCPAYLDIVDKFFMDMYAEFFASPLTPRSVNSKPRLYSLGS